MNPKAIIKKDLSIFGNTFFLKYKTIEIMISTKAFRSTDKSIPYVNWACYGNTSLTKLNDFFTCLRWALQICENIKEGGWEYAYNLEKVLKVEK